MVEAREWPSKGFESESLAWRHPESMSVSKWAEEFRRIEDKDSPTRGKWRNDLTPYLIQPLDALSDPRVDVVIMAKGARVGGSEWQRTGLAYWIDQDPGPTLMVYPTEPDAREVLADQIRPMIELTPRLARHMTGRIRDMKAGKLELDNMRLYLAWSGSPGALARRTIQYVLLDEIDKFPIFSGREASPVELAMRRTANYQHRRKIIITSTPTSRSGAIWELYERCIDRRQFQVPCPLCGAYQPLIWENVRYERRDGESYDAAASRIEVDRSARYQCAHCEGMIDEVKHKRKMVQAGEWVSDGYPMGEHPESRWRAYHIVGLLSLIGDSWSSLAAQWLRSQGNIAKLMDFFNGGLGLPYENELSKIKEGALERLASEQEPLLAGQCPEWTGAIVVTADTQKRGFWVVVRAHGRGGASRKLLHTFADGFEDLERFMASTYETSVSKSKVKPSKIFVDAGGGVEDDMGGNRTHQVYSWCRKSPTRRVPVKGWGGNAPPQRPAQMREVEYVAPPGMGMRAKIRLRLGMIDTIYFKDILCARIQGTELQAHEKWEPGEVDLDYAAQMESEHKVAVRKAGRLVQTWVPRTTGRANHYWDCEVYQLAAARFMHLDTLPGERELTKKRNATTAARTAPKPKRRFESPLGGAYLANRRGP